MQDRNSVPKRLGPGQNVLCPAINRSINQSCVNQSINNPDPAHQSISRFRAPAARFCKSDVMGAVCLPTSLPRCTNTWRTWAAAARILDVLQVAAGIPASMEFQGLLRPANLDRMRYRFTKKEK